METDIFEIMREYSKPKTATKLIITKLNRDNKICYYDAKDLSCKDFTDEQIKIISELFLSAGFKVEVKTHTYFGIYDPSRDAEIITLYPTDEQLDWEKRQRDKYEEEFETSKFDKIRKILWK